MDVTNDNFVAVEITGKGIKQITSIFAQYSKTSANQTSVIKQGRLVVFQEVIENLKLDSISPFGAADSPKIIFDANIDSFDPLQFNPVGKYLESKADGALTVVLVFPVTNDAADVIGRLTVVGNSKAGQLNNVKINKEN